MFNNLGLYLHIPFCQQKCAYCDFYSVEAPDEMMERYTDALLLHMEDYSQSALTHEVDTVYIGGGTPTVLPRKNLTAIMDGVYNHFNVSPDAEFSMEANPATVTLSDLKAYRRAGVNRLSFGMQSTSDRELQALGRIHTYDDFLDSYDAARRAQIDNINIDVMYGIPYQTPDSLDETLRNVCSLEPEHISLYNLKIEPGTPFARRADTLELPDEDTEYKMYCDAVDCLESFGYHQYEISNFAKDGFACRHNLKYWNLEEYLGLGPAAHSFYHERRFSFKRDLKAYIRAMEHPQSGIVITGEDYDIRESERIGEYVMLRMRLKEGVDTVRFAELFGLDFEKLYGKKLELYVNNGFMFHEGTNYSFTLKGMYVSNYILSSMIDFNSTIAEGIADGSDKA